MSNIKIISEEESLYSACERLLATSIIALDTEFMREKTYSPVLCLIQVKSAGLEFCIDPLALGDLGRFTQLLAEPHRQIILHSCRQDFEALDTISSHAIGNLFDTQIAAAFCGLGDQVSYAALVERFCGIKLAKTHTRADWLARPLSPEELKYAMDDVRYLEAIRDCLHDLLVQQDRLAWFEQECQQQVVSDSWRVDPDDAWRRLKGAGRLPVVAHETARRLAIWRERTAIERDRPREWILSTSALLEVSRLDIRSIGQLKEVDGINSGVIRRSAQAIIDVVSRTPRNPDTPPLWVGQEMLNPEQKQRVKGVMKLIRETAESMQLAPSLLANRNAVEKFVRGNIDLDLFQGWRRDVIGQKILQNYS